MTRRAGGIGWLGVAVGGAVVVAIGLTLGLTAPTGAAATGSAQVQDGDLEVLEDEEFDGRSTRDTVRLVVGSLVAIAAATTVLMFAFVWHTSPRRRLRIASRRAERRQAKALLDDYEGGFETSFFGGQAVAVGGGGVSSDLGVGAPPDGPADFDTDHLEGDADRSGSNHESNDDTPDDGEDDAESRETAE